MERGGVEEPIHQTCTQTCHFTFNESDEECLGCLSTSSHDVRGRLHGCKNLPFNEFMISLDSDPCPQTELAWRPSPAYDLATGSSDLNWTPGGRLTQVNSSFDDLEVDPPSHIGGLRAPLPSFNASSHNLGIGFSYSGAPNALIPSFIQSSSDHPDGLCGCYYGSRNQTALFKGIAGDPDHVALFVRVDIPERHLRHRLRHEIKALAHRRYHEWAEEPDKVPGEDEMRDIQGPTLRLFLENLAEDGCVSLPRLTKDLADALYDVKPFLKSLEAFQDARSVYHDLSGATVSLRVIDHPLHTARWVSEPGAKTAMLRRRRFACIAYFESGVYDMSPDVFSDVIAISTRNSLYISAILLGDPFETQDTSDDIRHVIGNVGKTGIVLMVAPLVPRVRPVDLGMWRGIAHDRFDGNRVDSFGATSLHLSFTEFEMPLDIGQRGSIDSDMHVRVVETIISVYDRADWVADLDVLLLYGTHTKENKFVRRLLR